MTAFKLYEIELDLKGFYYSTLNKFGSIFLSKNEFNGLCKIIVLRKKLMRIRELQIFINEDYLLNMPPERYYDELEDKIIKIIQKYK